MFQFAINVNYKYIREVSRYIIIYYTLLYTENIQTPLSQI